MSHLLGLHGFGWESVFSDDENEKESVLGVDPFSSSGDERSSGIHTDQFSESESVGVKAGTQEEPDTSCTSIVGKKRLRRVVDERSSDEDS